MPREHLQDSLGPTLPPFVTIAKSVFGPKRTFVLPLVVVDVSIRDREYAVHIFARCTMGPGYEPKCSRGDGGMGGVTPIPGSWLLAWPSQKNHDSWSTGLNRVWRDPIIITIVLVFEQWSDEPGPKSFDSAEDATTSGIVHPQDPLVHSGRTKETPSRSTKKYTRSFSEPRWINNSLDIRRRR